MRKRRRDATGPRSGQWVGNPSRRRAGGRGDRKLSPVGGGTSTWASVGARREVVFVAAENDAYDDRQVLRSERFNSSCFEFQSRWKGARFSTARSAARSLTTSEGPIGGKAVRSLSIWSRTFVTVPPAIGSFWLTSSRCPEHGPHPAPVAGDLPTASFTSRKWDDRLFVLSATIAPGFGGTRQGQVAARSRRSASA